MEAVFSPFPGMAATKEDLGVVVMMIMIVMVIVMMPTSIINNDDGIL